jgi:dTDP-4-amino-4,6-dideoxy-D-galactose acyltransferase
LTIDTTLALVPLPWDTNHFGFPVAMVTVPDTDDDAARHALTEAQSDGFRLVYWRTDPERPASQDLLRNFAGRLVDRKATFETELDSIDRKSTSSAASFDVAEYPKGPAEPALSALAIMAGEYSRFRIDPDVPPEKFAEMYTTWIERSARRELADVVLVARERDGQGLSGFVTIRVQSDAGVIGLIAVAAESRGRGIGGALIHAAHRWMIKSGCRRAEVVTQLTNVKACRLYERCGYNLREVILCYHFWPDKETERHG